MVKIIFILLFPVLLFAQKPCFVTYEAEHDSLCRMAYDSGFTQHCTNYYSISASGNTFDVILDSAIANNCDMVLYSHTGAVSLMPIIASRNIMVFMPTGANSDTTLYTGSYPEHLILTGAGDTANETARTVEFYDTDIIDHLNHSSYSNYYIAGKFAYIMNLKNWSIERIRSIARKINGYNNVKNGYGKFNETAIINFCRNSKLILK